MKRNVKIILGTMLLFVVIAIITWALGYGYHEYCKSLYINGDISLSLYSTISDNIKISLYSLWFVDLFTCGTLAFCILKNKNKEA